MRIVTDLGVGSAPARPRQGWSPAWLFRGGAAGAWYDLTAEGSVWRDTEGTLPALPGDGVARLDDLSGQGNHLTQPVVAARPMLGETGGRRHLQFNGVNTFLQAPQIDMSGRRMTVIAALHKDSDAASGVPFSSRVNQPVPSTVLFAPNGAGTPTHAGRWRGLLGTRTVLDGTAPAPTSDVVTLAGDADTGVLTFRRNGVPAGEDSNDPDIQDFGLQQPIVGSMSASGGFFLGRLHGLLFVADRPGDSMLARAEGWFAAKAGI